MRRERRRAQRAERAAAAAACTRREHAAQPFKRAVVRGADDGGDARDARVGRLVVVIDRRPARGREEEDETRAAHGEKT